MRTPIERSVRVARTQAVRIPVNDGLGRGLATLGNAVQSVAEDELAKVERRQEIDARADYVSGLNDLTLSLDDVDDPELAEREFKQREYELRRTALARLSDRRRAGFEAQINPMAEGRRFSLMGQAGRRQQDNGRDALNNSLDSLASARAGAGSIDEARAIEAEVQEQIAVAREAGLLTAEEAEATRTAWAGRTQEVSALRILTDDPRAAFELFSDPDRFTGLDPLKKESYRARAKSAMESAANAARQQSTAARVEASLALSEIDAIVREGLQPSEEVFERAFGFVQAAGDRRLADRFKDQVEAMNVAAGLRQAAPAQIETFLNQKRAQASEKGASQADAIQIDVAESILANAEKGLREDQISYFIRQGHEVPDLNLDDPAAFAERAAVIDGLAAEYGVRPKYLTDQQADLVALQLEDSRPTEQAALLGFLSRAAGPDRAAGVFGQLSQKDQSLGHVAGLVSVGNEESAIAALRGRELAKSEKAVSELLPARAVRLEVLRDEFGAAFEQTPGVRAGLLETAEHIYLSKSKGVPQEDGPGQSMWREALQEAAGQIKTETGPYGGVVNVRGRDIVIPNTVRATESDVIRRLEEIGASDVRSAAGGKMVDKDGEEIEASELARMHLIWLGGDEYYLSTTNPDRSPALVLDDQTLRPFKLKLGGATRQKMKPVSLPDLGAAP